MSGRDSALEEADAASGFSDLSDSEFLQIEEPQEGVWKVAVGPLPEVVLRNAREPNCSALWPLKPVGSGEVAKRKAQSTAKRKRTLSPLETFRLLYLSVTDLAAQVWCEQQMVYRREYPDLRLPEQTAVLNMGKTIHLARELEDHELMPICITSREDSWAVKMLNLLGMIPVLQSAQRVREFPVFGVLEGVFIVGIIDQLGYTEKGELELSELKTRNMASMPSAAQKKRDNFQVCLYKHLFDTMVKGDLRSEVFIQHLHLRPQQTLGPMVKQQANAAGFTVGCFQDLLELTCLNLIHSDIPTIDCLQVEYVHQGTNNLIGTEVVAYDQEDVRAAVQDFLAYWKGKRDPKGVDIEDAWKCHYCPYASLCDWGIWRSGNSMKGNRQKKSR